MSLAPRGSRSGTFPWRANAHDVRDEPSVAGETDRYLGLYRTMLLIRGFEDLDPVALPPR